jgi:hypothetical protein
MRGPRNRKTDSSRHEPLQPPATLALVLLGLAALGVGPLLAAPADPQREPFGAVIGQSDEDAVRRLLDDFVKHTKSPDVMLHSRTQPFLDCPARPKLLRYGWKAVPYVIEQAARKEAVDAYVGSALIKDKKVQTPEQVFQYNRDRKRKVEEATLPGFVLEILLRELPSGSHEPDRKEGKGIHLHHYNECYKWVPWWQAHKNRFQFETKRPPVIPPAKDDHSSAAQIRASVQDGLLDVYAVSASYRDIIRRAAKEMGIEVVIGKQDYLDVITTLRMKSVTFEEFLYMLGRSVCITGFDYHETADGYVVGKLGGS